MDKKAQAGTVESTWEECLKWAAEKDDDFYERCEAAGVKAADIPLAQLSSLPLQAGIVSQSAFSRLTMPLSGVSRMMGTTPYLAEEMQVWAASCEAWLKSCHVTLASVLLIADGFAGDAPAWGMLKGAEALQATVVTSADRPWEVIAGYGVTAVALTAPLLQQWIDSGAGAGGCRAFFCLSSLADEQRRKWQEKLGVPIYRQLGLPGVQSSVMAWECCSQHGYHWPLEVFWPEIVDRQTSGLLPAGALGELVITALQRRSTTAIRLRTGWQGSFAASCRCGSPLPRFVLAET